MRIKEVMELTNLSKRSIHFYIDQNLINPSINPLNGYTDFSSSDVERLLVIQKLRLMDFSIADIRSMMTGSNTAYYYLYLQKKKLQNQQQTIQNQLDVLHFLTESIHINMNIKQLTELITDASLSHPTKPVLVYEPSDVRLVYLFLFNVYLANLPMTEYRGYLWEKIIRRATNQNAKHFEAIGTHMLSLTPEQIEHCFICQDVHTDRIAHLATNEYDGYMEEMIRAICLVLDTPAYVRVWKELYPSYLHPSACIYSSEINRLMQEMSPMFAAYKKNINSCCTKLYERLYTDLSYLRTRIEKVLKGYINLHISDHGELEALVSFLHLQSFVTEK